MVTGGAGFIGSNFVRRTLDDAYPGLEGAEVTVLDALTYSGNLANLEPVADSARYGFVHGDIRDRAAAGRRAAGRRRDRALRRRVARRPLGAGCRGLRRDQRARHAAPARRRPRARRRQVRPRLHRRGVRLDRGGLVERGPRPGAELPLLGVEGGQRPRRAQLPPHPRAARLDHALLEQLRAVPLPGEGHPAVRHEPHRRRARAAVRRRRERSRLAARRRPHPRDRPRAGSRTGRRDLQHRRRHRADQPRAHPEAAGRDRARLVVRRPGRGPQGPRPPLQRRHRQDPRRARLRAARAVRHRVWPTSCSGTATTAPGGSRSRSGAAL